MRSGTLCFNGTLFRKCVTRFWPIWAVSAVAWLLYMPLNALMQLRQDVEHGTDRLQSFAWDVASGSTALIILFAVCAGLLAAMAVCSCLYTTRSANFMGALPVRREGLFLSHYLAGLAMLLAPNVLAFCLTVVVEAAGGALVWEPLLVWLGTLCGAEFFFYSFAVFLGMFTGHILALPVFYGVFNALAAAVYILLQWVMEIFYYGFAELAGGVRAVCWLTPIWRLSEKRKYFVQTEWFRGIDLAAVGIYALAAVVLTGAAVLLFRQRQLECAGDVVAVRAMRPVFKYGVGVCAGLFFGFLTGELLGFGTVGLMAAIVVWGAVGYFVAQMFLDKTFRVLRAFPGAIGLTAAFAVLFLVVGLDLTGYETRVPDVSSVDCVRIEGLLIMDAWDSGSYVDEYVSQPAQIEAVTALHQAIVAHRDSEGDSGGGRYVHVGLTYTLKNGSALSRNYSVWLAPEKAEQADSVAFAVEQLRADRTLAAQIYGFSRAEAFENGDAEGRLYSAEWQDETKDDYRMIYEDEARTLLDAVKADFEAGVIGIQSLFAEEEPIGRLDFEWIGKNSTQESLAILVYPSSVRTLAVLAALEMNSAER